MAVNETIERIVYEGVDKITAVSKSAESSVKRLHQSLDAVKSVLGALGVTVGAGAMVALTMDALKATAALDDMAESTGASVEGLSAIQRVAKVGGHDFDGLTGQISRMVKGLRDGTDEGGRTAQAFAFLGVQAREADGRFRDTSEILVEFARKLETVTDRGNRNLLVQDALGKGAERYIPLLKEIAEGTDLVVTTTAKQAQQAEEAEKNIRRLTLAYTDSRRELVNEYTPALIRFTEQLLAAQKTAGGFWAFLSLSGKQADDPLAALAELDARLAKLRSTRDVLAGDSLGAKFNRMMAPEDLTVLGMQIRTAERQRELLREMLQRRVSGNATGLAEDAAGNVGPAPATNARVYNPLAEGAEAKAQKEREFIARQLQEGMEEEQRIQQEAFHWTAFYADKKLEVAKATEQARIQAIIDAYEREQELAIEQGEQLSAGPSYTLRLEALRQTHLDEAVLEAEAHTKRLDELQRFSDEELEIFGGRYALIEQLNSQHQQRMLDIESRRRIHRQLDLNSARTFFVQMSGLMNTESRKMFEIGKAGAIAGAIIDTYKAATGAYRALAEIPIVGPALGAAAAAAATLAGMANVNAIRSTTFGGGGGATPTFPASPTTGLPLGSPGGASPTADETPPRRDSTIIINLPPGRGPRDLYTRDEVREFIRALNEELVDGSRIVFQ